MKLLNIPYNDYISLDVAGFVAATLPTGEVGEIGISENVEVTSSPYGSGRNIQCSINSLARSERFGVPAGMVVIGLTAVRA